MEWDLTFAFNATRMLLEKITMKLLRDEECAVLAQ